MNVATSRSTRLIEAYDMMRKGVLYLLIADLILSIIVIVSISSLMIVGFRTIIEKGPGRFIATQLLKNLSSHLVPIDLHVRTSFVIAEPKLTFIVFLFIGFVASVTLFFIGLWGKFLPGLGILKDVVPEISTAESLIRIGYFWGLILLLVSIPLVFLIIGILTFVISLILIFLGNIGLIILSFKLRDIEKDDLYLVSGVLFIIGLIFRLMNLFAWIILYISLGKSIEKHKSHPSQPTSLPFPPI
ncbi:MAG: DUF973 family protein [Desulfurococcaceae archaeon]